MSANAKGKGAFPWAFTICGLLAVLIVIGLRSTRKASGDLPPAEPAVTGGGAAATKPGRAPWSGEPRARLRSGSPRRPLEVPKPAHAEGAGRDLPGAPASAGPAPESPANEARFPEPGQPTLTFGSRPGSRVSIEGTSSIHDWKIEGAIIGGAIVVCPAFSTDKSLKTATCLGDGNSPKVAISIPIRSLHSQVEIAGDKMDRIVQEALRMREYPAITCRTTEMKVKGAVPESGSPVVFDTKGQLQVAGVTNVIEMEVVMNRVGDNGLQFAGSLALKMSDYGIRAVSGPVFGGNRIETGDKVTVRFEWVTAAKTSGSP